MNTDIKTLAMIAGHCVAGEDAIRTMAAGLDRLSQDNPGDPVLHEAAENWTWLSTQGEVESL